MNQRMHWSLTSMHSPLALNTTENTWDNLNMHYSLMPFHCVKSLTPSVRERKVESSTQSIHTFSWSGSNRLEVLQVHTGWDGCILYRWWFIYHAHCQTCSNPESLLHHLSLQDCMTEKTCKLTPTGLHCWIYTQSTEVSGIKSVHHKMTCCFAVPTEMSGCDCTVIDTRNQVSL